MGSSIFPLAPPGYNRGLLRDAVALIAEAPWSTTGVEQGHGSMAVLHRFHPDYSSTTICARALAHQLRTLFATPPEAQQKQKPKHSSINTKTSALRNEVDGMLSWLAAMHLWLLSCQLAPSCRIPFANECSRHMLKSMQICPCTSRRSTRQWQLRPLLPRGGN